MERRGFLIELIYVADNRRPLNVDNVRSIAESIKEVGLANPPAVRIVDRMMIDGEEELGVPVLIHGRHRIEALKSMGVAEVDCIVHDIDETDARIMEIDENIRRADLGEPELGLQLKERKRLYEKKHPESKAGVNQHVKSAVAKLATAPAPRFTKETAEASGKSERVIQRSIQRVEALGVADAEKIIGTSLASGVEMDALASLPDDDRDDLIERARSGEVVSAREPKSDFARKAAQRTAFWKMWAKLDDDVRQELLSALKALPT